MITLSIEPEIGGFEETVGKIEVEDDLGEQTLSVEFSFSTTDEETGAFAHEDLKKDLEALVEKHAGR